ncbi:hypothetical protein BDZ91DRAFT_795568 [Kalaharituber pfeilii]|nr:hypothetical protein BDZ91DRAFT_795568 [Kalaharituber pfeilii]
MSKEVRSRIDKGEWVALVGEDVKSAFVRRDRVVAHIERVDRNLAAFVQGFLQPTSFNLSWGGKRRPTSTMTDGTLQGSPPLSSRNPAFNPPGPARILDQEGYELDQGKREVMIFGVKGPDYRMAGLLEDWELKFNWHFRQRLSLEKAAWAVATRLGQLGPAKRRQIYTSIARTAMARRRGYTKGAPPEQMLRELEKWQYTTARTITGAPWGTRRDVVEGLANLKITEKTGVGLWRGRSHSFYIGAKYIGAKATVNDVELVAMAKSPIRGGRGETPSNGLQSGHSETQIHSRGQPNTWLGGPPSQRSVGEQSNPRGIGVAMVWVKGHKGLEGAERVDKAAKISALLPYQGEVIMEAGMLMEAKAQRAEERDRLRLGYRPLSRDSHAGRAAGGGRPQGLEVQNRQGRESRLVPPVRGRGRDSRKHLGEMQAQEAEVAWG